MTLILFTLAWILSIYLFNSALARQFKRVDVVTALLYITTIALIGPFGEVFLGTFYKVLVGSPLWQYQLFPIHNAHASLYGVVVWGMYGFYLYLLHDNLAHYNFRTRRLAVIIAFEAMILELLINTTYYLTFGGYFFYYLPNDLWHFTTIQVIPFYFVAGVVMVKTLKRFRADPAFFIAMNVMLAFVFVFLAS